MLFHIARSLSARPTHLLLHLPQRPLQVTSRAKELVAVIEWVSPTCTLPRLPNEAKFPLPIWITGALPCAFTIKVSDFHLTTFFFLLGGT